MLDNLSHIFITNFKSIIIHLIALFFFVLNIQSYPFFLNQEVRPFFVLIILFFWAIYQPSLFNPIYIFLIGIFYDVYFNFSLGLHSLIFLFMYFTLSKQRLFLMGQNYYVVFLIFLLVALGVYTFELLFYSVILGSVQSYKTVLYDFLITTSIFPIIHFIHIPLRNYLTSYGVKS